MSLQLYFNLATFPRTITRKEWKEIWRWKRIMEQKLNTHAEEMAMNMSMFGHSHPGYQDWLDQVINPPLLIHDRQEF